MRGEIFDVPAVVRRFLDSGHSRVVEAAKAVKGRFRHVTFVARGTSEHAAVFGRYLCETQLGVSAGLAAPSVTTIYRAEVDRRESLVVAVSQSGHSPDLVAVVDDARRGGAVTVAITNNPRSPLATASDHVIDCRAGHEQAVAATKSYVAQLVALGAFFAALSPATDLWKDLERLPLVLEACLEESTVAAGARSLSEVLTGADRALVVGRGVNLATALEMGLKLKETCRIFADAYSTAAFEHGPVVLAGPDVPVIAVRPNGPGGAAMDAVIARAEAAGSPVWTIGGSEVPVTPRSISLSHTPADPLSACALVIPGLLAAEEVSRRRGFDPDAPNGLSKVTHTL